MHEFPGYQYEDSPLVTYAWGEHGSFGWKFPAETQTQCQVFGVKVAFWKTGR